ncbi:MAG: hypothetical protein Kow0074_11530 [Candidatus Zixiibacteriota bacterium]
MDVDGLVDLPVDTLPFRAVDFVVFALPVPVILAMPLSLLYISESAGH